ncbi:IclR family transcriptional regulator [Psychrobacter sp. FDAARGOS_221]|nr:IclR family transcriptional regulator [Psychrobacter sp. FDAARGOS_221]
MSSSKSKPQGGVQSLEVGLAVLDVLIDQNEPMMLKDIAQAIDMHPAKVHRYLVSLIRKNYAKQQEDGRYALGQRASALGYIGLNSNNILDRLTQAAIAIKDITNCSVQIAKWFSEGPIIIQSFESDTPISIITRIGSRMPLCSSATGRLFASYLAEDTIRPMLEQESDEHSKSGSKAASSVDSRMLSWEAFVPLKQQTIKQGYAYVEGRMLLGINAISVPFYHYPVTQAVDRYRLEYALTVIGTAEQLPLNTDGNSDNKSSSYSETVDQILSICRAYQV